jgi:tRNA-specific 2-thiouridylase
MNSATAVKDQTYALNQLQQDQLAHTLMPIGQYTKDEIRQIAVDAGIPVANKPDSQDICFIPDGDYKAFLKKYANRELPSEGNFVNEAGEILGKHKGITNYTVGQRKGLGIALGKPVFVSAIRPETNEVVISDTGDVFSRELYCNKLNFMAVEDLTEPTEVIAKIRYAHKGSPCTIEKVDEDTVKCTFHEDVRAITPGQSVVFYQNDYVFGGGIII